MVNVARKTSLYIDTADEAIAAARDAHPVPASRRAGKRSAIFRELLRRYDEICRGDCPGFSDEDWTTLVSIGREWGKRDVSSAVRMATLIEAAGDDRLLKKLLGMRVAQRIAVVDFIERYWAARARGEEPPSFPSEDLADLDRHPRRRP